MKALSVKQPYASLICAGIKDIENRTWYTKKRERVFIHASGVKAKGFLSLLNKDQVNYLRKKSDLEFGFPCSSIIGEVDIVDCVINHPSLWAEKTKDHLLYEDPISGKMTPYFKRIHGLVYNWVLANPVLYDKPILNVKGKLSFWDYELPTRI